MATSATAKNGQDAATSGEAEVPEKIIYKLLEPVHKYVTEIVTVAPPSTTTTTTTSTRTTTSSTTSSTSNSSAFLLGVSQSDAFPSLANPAVIGGIALLSVAAFGLLRNVKGHTHVALHRLDESTRTLTSFSRPDPEDVPTLTPREPEQPSDFRYAPVDTPGFVSVRMDGGRYVEDRTGVQRPYQ
eukprot:CAMPEP_0169091778 /NCGR_PEP_ID=MMETSP1015-20121227/16554_1 /TAXON_ID=342587 /ORGANISM="Karlodinium micrum, Strain CCMP2283" /LENGTH=184 /DNA_ID=CAMNT_0009152313 /DNA_START=324 /DNA_END=878 /DNA_ORIENTATION=+